MHVCMQMYPLLNFTCTRYRFENQRYVINFRPYSLLVPSSELETAIIVTDPHYWINNALLISLLKSVTRFWSPLLNQSPPPNGSSYPWCMNSTTTCKYDHSQPSHFWPCTSPISLSPQHNKHNMQIYSTIHNHIKLYPYSQYYSIPQNMLS